MYYLSPAKRRNVAENIAGAAGRAPSRRTVLGIFRLQAVNIIEMFASSVWDKRAIAGWFEFEGREELDRALAEGAGVILVTAHIGSWELGALSLDALGYRLHVVAGVQMNRLLTGAVREAKERHGIEVINPEDSSRRLLKALAGGGVLALLVDGNVFTGGAEVPFFGRRVKLPAGPVRLALASGAPVIGGYCRRIGDRRFKVHLERIASAREIEALGEEKSLEHVYGAVERYIGKNPDQWCMFRRFWHTNGTGAAAGRAAGSVGA